MKGKKQVKKKEYATLDLINDLLDDLPEIESQLKSENKQNTLEWISVSLFERGKGKLTKEWNITTTMKSPIEQLKEKIKNRDELIDLIETVGKDQICNDYNTGYDTLDSLIDEWDVKAKFLNAGERFLRKIGGREQLINLVKNYSLTQLSKKYKVGSNTIKRLLEKLDIRHGKHF